MFNLLASEIYFDKNISRNNLSDTYTDQEIYKMFSYKSKRRYVRGNMRIKQSTNKNYNYFNRDTMKYISIFYVSTRKNTSCMKRAQQVTGSVVLLSMNPFETK